MKAAFGILATLVILAIAAPVGAQDWVMDWTSRGMSVGILTGPFSEGWSISGSSPSTLTPLPGGLPSDFSKPAYNLSFTWEGRSYGGPVSEQSNFQSAIWNAPVPCAGIFSANCKITASAFGDFAFTDANHFSLDVLVGTPHSFTELAGIGTRVGGGGTVGAPEPATMALGAIGLLGAALLRRRRHRES